MKHAALVGAVTVCSLALVPCAGAALSEPQDLRGVADSHKLVNELSWNTPEDTGTGITGYNVYEGIGVQAPRLLRATTKPTDRAVSVSAQRGRDYWYEVAAVDSTGEGPRATLELFQRAYAPDEAATRDCPEPGTFKSGCSPFNQPIPENPKLDENNTAVTDWLKTLAPGQKNIPYDPKNFTLACEGCGDGQFPVYWAWVPPGIDPTTSLTRFDINCTSEGGSCEFSPGESLFIPTGARAASPSPPNGDAHLASIQLTPPYEIGREYDFWKVKDDPLAPPTITFQGGGKTNIEEDGLGSDHDAAHTGALAGPIMATEMAAGEIDHALAMGVPCVKPGHVYPAEGQGAPCSGLGLTETDKPQMGARFQLDPSYIIPSSVPGWKRTILTALQRYGAYIVDTGGNPAEWSVARHTSDQSYTSFLGAGQGSWYKWVSAADSADDGITFDDAGTSDDARDDAFKLNFDAGDGFEWANHLRVIDPCVTQKTCVPPEQCQGHGKKPCKEHGNGHRGHGHGHHKGHGHGHHKGHGHGHHKRHERHRS
jgi:hypothetical protein